MVFAGFLKISARGWGLSTIFSAGVEVSHFLCARRLGNWPIKNMPGVFPGGGVGWSGVELICA